MDMVRSARALIGWKKWQVEALRDAKASTGPISPPKCVKNAPRKVFFKNRQLY